MNVPWLPKTTIIGDYDESKGFCLQEAAFEIDIKQTEIKSYNRLINRFVI